MRKCLNCICHTCLNARCNRKKCSSKKIDCKKYVGFKQLTIFEIPSNPGYQSTPRCSWEHYGITKERRAQLTQYIRSGKYAHLASQEAHTANETIAEYLIISIAENKSYDALEKMWARGKIERIPYGKTDFYGIRRYFMHLMDLEMRKIGK